MSLDELETALAFKHQQREFYAERTDSFSQKMVEKISRELTKLYDFYHQQLDELKCKNISAIYLVRSPLLSLSSLARASGWISR